MELLNQIIEFIQNNLMAQAAILGGVLDFIMRLLKTEKPMSLLYVVRGAIEMGVAFIMKVADLGKAIIAFLDKLLPQRLKDPAQPQ